MTADIIDYLELRDGADDALVRLGKETASRLCQTALSRGLQASTVDVEALFTTVEMLAVGDSSPIAPFIAGWNSPAVTRQPLDWAQTYAALGEAMLDALQHVLKPTNSPDYLQPLFSDPPCRIATLNYDLCLEQAASAAAIELSDGIEAWTGGFHWTWGQEPVHLLKLHGSINWQPVVTTLGGAARAGDPLFTHGDSLRGTGSHALEIPGLVFGVQGKLRADGPFLAMLMEFSRWMESTDRLVVVGYSFRDKHINRVIVDWLEQRPPRTLDVIDPGVPEHHEDVMGEPGSLLEDLVNYATEQNVGCPGPSSWWSRKPMVQFHREAAAHGLERLLRP
ncbi:SIR2 family protein [Tessaracoccus sp. MC1679]|uniref:SIR2 family protein n=1 Tax=Tessaracoccus sp. MC1679 TaxID=2760313 RepID=UPI001600C443|nr:SIR2 family protein [Tessaracoccus sp. MC1679]MBB1517473.1 SIR2 family protein [Tessaracoccus sp. MC1679]